MSDRVASLAALLRELDGDHTLGAGALAEALIARGVTAGSRLGEPSPEGPELIVTLEIRARLAIREAIHRTALAAARLTPHNLQRRYLTQDNKDAILESVLEDFPGARCPAQETP